MDGGAISSLPRFSVSHQNLSLKIEPTKKATQACIVVGIPLQLDSLVLLALKNNTKYSFSSSDVDTTIVAFCGYQNVYKAIAGSVQLAMSNKVVGMNVGYDKGEFLISILCDKSFTAVRKVAGIAMKQLKFSNTTPQYKAYCDMLGIKSDMSGFAFAVNTCNKAVDNGVNITVTGRLSIDKEKANSMVKTISDKVRDNDNKDSPVKRQVTSDVGENNLLVIKVSGGLDKIISKNYIDAHLMESIMIDGNIYLPAKMESRFSALDNKDKINGFAAKLLKLGDDLAGMLSFGAAIQATLNTRDLTSGKEMDKSKVVSAIKSTF